MKLSQKKGREIETSESDEWATPRWFFAAMESLYGGFDIDVASTVNNTLCRQHLTKYDDALGVSTWAQYSTTRRAWCNPPYSKPHLDLFTARARREVELMHLELVSCLIPMSTSALWWHENIERPGDVIKRITANPSHPLGARTLTQTPTLDIEVLRVRGRLSFDGEVRGTARFHSVVVTFATPGILQPHLIESRGRPIEFTDEQRADVERFIAEGQSQAEACRSAGVSRATWYRHKEKHTHE
jgi:phage N-6-adenine-methyltransferase